MFAKQFLSALATRGAACSAARTAPRRFAPLVPRRIATESQQLSKRMFSTAPMGNVDRGDYPAYVPLNMAGGVSANEPITLTVDQAISMTETINSVLSYGVYTNARFKDIAQQDINPAVKYQLMMEALVEVQLYAALPYGFESSPKGFQDLSMSLGQLVQSFPDPESEDFVELTQVFSETWGIVVKQVFDTDVTNRLALSDVQVISAKLSAAFQDQTFLGSIEAKVGPLPPEQKQLAIEELSYDVFVPIMEEFEFEGEKGFAQLKVEITNKMADPQVQMNLMAIQRALATKAGLM